MQNGMFLPTVLLRAGALACLLFAAPLLAQGSADAGGVLTGSNALQWRNIGPFRGGRVIAVSGVVKQPNLFYMGASSGGVWKTTNYGKSWENLSDGQFANANIGAIAVAPSDPQVIYVGTGESAIRNSALMGDGMYKSIDAGKTWKRIGLDETQIISRIVVDQKDPNLVYVAALGHEFGSNAERGVFKSSDGGNTWKKILFVDNNTGAIDLVVNPRNPQILYAATWQVYRRAWTLESGGPGSGIWKSSDGGGHWVRIGHGTGLPAGIYGRIGLGIAPSDPDVMYAMVHAKDGGVFRSDDAGASWHRVNDEQSLTQRAFYYSTLFVSPKDADTVYFPQVDGLFVSHDGGRKIALVNGHHDDHALWINPDNPEVMVEGYDFGVSVTQDGGQSWSSVNNQQTGQFYHVNLDDQFPFHVYGAQQDGGSYAGPSATRGAGIPREAWIEVPGSESNRVVPEPGKPWITYGTGYSSFNSAYWKGNARTGVWEHQQLAAVQDRRGPFGAETAHRLVPFAGPICAEQPARVPHGRAIPAEDHGRRLQLDLDQPGPHTQRQDQAGALGWADQLGCHRRGDLRHDFRAVDLAARCRTHLDRFGRWAGACDHGRRRPLEHGDAAGLADVVGDQLHRSLAHGQGRGVSHCQPLSVG
jgi:photosystem II stability/assembly factor-like uncharacterized protein